MAAVRITHDMGVVAEQAFGAGAVAAIADLVEFEDVAAAQPHRRALGRRLQQIAQGWHRAIMQVGRTAPNAVERLVGIPPGLAEMAETPGITSIEQVLRR